MAESARTAKSRWEPWADPNATAHVQIAGVTKNFGEFVAVDNVSLDIYKGEFFSLLGPSGCGKTTLLRMLAGFETPSNGSILLEGDDMSAVPPYQRPVNMMFQSYALFPHMTAEQNIAFGLKQDRVPKDEISERVSEMIRLVQLDEFTQRKPHQLSGGQRQRVALARSLVKKPKMLLLDEPLGALDKKLRQQTQFELVNIQEGLGITFVIVTHDQEEAMTVSTRIAVMDHGRIVQVATPGELYEYPSNRYVASFIGDVNVIEGRVATVETDHIDIRSAQTPCALRASHAADVPNGTPVWVAIRPEKLHISLDAPADPTVNCMQGEVVEIGYLGNLSVYHVELAGGKRVTSTQTNQTRLTERAITWEDKVYLTWTDDAGVVLVEPEQPAVIMADDSSYLDGRMGPSESHAARLHQRFSSFAPYRWLYGALLWLFSKLGLSGRTLVIALPYLWLLLFFLAPFLIVFRISFSEIAIAIPPYSPILERIDDIYLQLTLNLENYMLLVEDDLYWRSYVYSLRIAGLSTVLALLVGYPIAYAMARAPKQWRPLLLMLVILPFWTSFLIRVYAWIGILKKEGLLNLLLMSIGIIDEPLTILNTNTAVYIGIVYSYLPFMVLPLYATLEKMDLSLLEAAADLGCRPIKAFWLITVPLSLPGIVAGCFLVFIPAVGEFVIPDLLGGSDTIMIGKTLWSEFFNNRDWPLSSAVAVVLLLLLIIPIVLFQRMQERSGRAS